MQGSVPTVPQSGIDISRLRRFELFKDLADRELSAIARCCRKASHPADTLVLRQGEVAREIFFLEDGAVNVYSEKLGQIRRIALIEAPGVFGEFALMNCDHVRTATVRAATDVQVLALSFANMIAALRSIPALKEHFRLLLQQRGIGDSSATDSGTITPTDETAKLEALCG